ncbi:protein tyrosine phosphatase [Caulobacter sp.]|uniref:tyrosine phosphatase family protein n=1 Tax=Caulobacter sp. TaxID=78 RepID=UPI001B15A103|nr:protein tyrosine phosphatase [Caulobacter sp.]MBO9545149.1 protein tyrosine phosphatase [Caulobacter sp.]
MRLLVGPISAVERLAGEADHALSLISPDARAPVVARPRTLLRFNDIAEDREGLVAPSAAMIETILSLAGTPTLLIHCFAGVSRSTAAAYILACAHGGDEQALAAQLRSLCPEATPNPLMVALADAILQRDGAMSRAIASIGRGVYAFEGTAIDWRL